MSPARDFTRDQCRMIRLGKDRVQVHIENHTTGARKAGKTVRAPHLVLQPVKGGQPTRLLRDSAEARELVEDYPQLAELRCLDDADDDLDDDTEEA